MEYKTEFKFEILEADLRDRQVLINMRVTIESEIEKLSAFGKNTMVKELNGLRGSLEWCENAWLFCQRERVLNKLSEHLNVDRERMGDKEWHDD